MININKKLFFSSSLFIVSSVSFYVSLLSVLEIYNFKEKKIKLKMENLEKDK